MRSFVGQALWPRQHALRGFDALHLAAAEVVKDNELVFVSGDAALYQAASDLGIQVATT